jgi:hypothetical protein
VQGAGQIVATGGAGQTGGAVDVLGERVAVMDQARIDVSGGQGGGTVRVGGDYQGKNAALPNAAFIYFGPQAAIAADAKGAGKGGRVILWADDTARAHGSISARGGAQGGDGGFVETSGKQSLEVTGLRVDTRASAGKTGLWFLDPNDIDIVAGASASAGTAPSFSAGASTSTLGVTDLLNALDSSAVSVTASGNLTVSTAIDDSGNTNKNNLSLTASSGTLAVNANISLTDKDLGLESTTGDINLNGDLTLGTGTLKLVSGTGISQTITKVITASNLSVESAGTAAGDVALTGLNLVGTLAANRNAGAGGFAMVNAQTLTVGTVGSVVGVTASDNAAGIDISTTMGDLVIDQSVVSGTNAGGQISLSAAGNLTINQAVTSMSGTTPVGPVILQTLFGNITGDPTNGIITTAGLGVNSGGTVALTASNTVAGLGGASASDFSFVAAGGFEIGYGFPGIISMGDINLTSLAGAITQSFGAAVATPGALSLNAATGINLASDAASMSATNTTSGDIAFAHLGGGVLTLGTLDVGSSGGRWMIFAADPTFLNKGSYTSSFRTYGALYDPLSLPIDAGNGFIYASPGVLGVNTTLSSGTASNVFGAAPTAVFGHTFANASFIDSEDLALIAGTPVFSPTITSATAAAMYSIDYLSGLTAPSGITFALGTGLSYTVSPASVSVNTLNLSGTRTYDGTNVVNGSIFSIGGLIGSDTLVLSGSGTVANKNVGMNKPVTLGSLALANGTGLASNYTLTGGTHVATITQAAITGVTGITAVDRPYNGTTTAGLTTTAAVFAGMMTNDNLILTSANGAFVDKNVGTAKAVSITGLAFGGSDVGNYTFSSVSAAATQGNITQRPLSIWQGPASGGNWSDAANWDALPDASNVAAVSLPSAGTVVYNASAGSTTVQSLSGTGTLAMSGGSLAVTGGLSLQNYQQTDGALTTPGAFNVDVGFSQGGGTIVAGGPVAITQTSGDLQVGSISAPSITLAAAAGGISQIAGLVTPGLLTTQSRTATVLNSAANRVGAFKAVSTGAGNIELTNVGVIDVRGMRTTAGSIALNNTGGVGLSGPVVARGGRITGVANSPLTVGPDGVSADGDIVLTATNLTSAGNITLFGPVGSTGGSVTLTAANNLIQYGTVSGALGVTASSGGTTVLGVAASTAGTPVSYTSAGGTFQLGKASSADSGSVYGQIFEDTRATQTGGGTPKSLDRLKDSARNKDICTDKSADSNNERVVADGEAC